MSSVNVDKALQIRPPIAIYVLEVDTNAQTFDIPGVPNNIGGSGPEGAHTMITNFLSVQADPNNAEPTYISFGGPNLQDADAGARSTNGSPPIPASDGWGANPNPASGGCIAVSPGETVRFDMSDLFVHGVAPALQPIEFMSAIGGAGDVLRIWRSSGR